MYYSRRVYDFIGINLILIPHLIIIIKSYNQFFSDEGFQKGTKFVFTVLILTSIDSLDARVWSVYQQ